MGAQNGVVRFNNGSGNLWGGVNWEFKLGFLSVVDWKTFEQESSEPRTGTTTERVEDQETLETGTVVGKFSDSVKDKINNFFSDGVVTTSVI